MLSRGRRLTSPFGRIFCSSSLKAVPIFRLTVGGSSPGSSGYSLGSFPVSSCEKKNKFESSELEKLQPRRSIHDLAEVASTTRTASLMQMLLSSSSLFFSVSSSASCRALSAASMSFLAVWELSDS